MQKDKSKVVKTKVKNIVFKNKKNFAVKGQNPINLKAMTANVSPSNNRNQSYTQQFQPVLHQGTKDQS